MLSLWRVTATATPLAGHNPAILIADHNRPLADGTTSAFSLSSHSPCRLPQGSLPLPSPSGVPAPAVALAGRRPSSGLAAPSAEPPAGPRRSIRCHDSGRAVRRRYRAPASLPRPELLGRKSLIPADVSGSRPRLGIPPTSATLGGSSLFTPPTAFATSSRDAVAISISRRLRTLVFLRLSSRPFLLFSVILFRRIFSFVLFVVLSSFLSTSPSLAFFLFPLHFGLTPTGALIPLLLITHALHSSLLFFLFTRSSSFASIFLLFLFAHLYHSPIFCLLPYHSFLSFFFFTHLCHPFSSTIFSLPPPLSPIVLLPLLSFSLSTFLLPFFLFPLRPSLSFSHFFSSPLSPIFIILPLHPSFSISLVTHLSHPSSSTAFIILPPSLSPLAPPTLLPPPPPPAPTRSHQRLNTSRATA